MLLLASISSWYKRYGFDALGPAFINQPLNSKLLLMPCIVSALSKYIYISVCLTTFPLNITSFKLFNSYCLLYACTTLALLLQPSTFALSITYFKLFNSYCLLYVCTTLALLLQPSTFALSISFTIIYQQFYLAISYILCTCKINKYY